MDRYHIYEAIGRGKHSVVYKGRRKKTIQYYAIKSVDKSQRPRVLQEVQVLRSVSHPLVLKFHAWYETKNHLWLILEYCVGGDLLGLLKQDERLPERSVAVFARDLVAALRVLHRAGTLHCDLKPSNVLMDEDGRLKLCGFGLARKVADVTSSRGAPGQLSKRGTPCYMAPELFREGGVHSFASDLWALGCVMYECAAGRPPFVSSSLSELMEMILTDDPPPVDDKKAAVSPEFENLVARLLDKDPTRRLDWDGLLSHPFWTVDPTVASQLRAVGEANPLPPQPAFEAAARRAREAVDAAETPDRDAEGTGGGERGGGGDARGGDVGERGGGGDARGGDVGERGGGGDARGGDVGDGDVGDGDVGDGDVGARASESTRRRRVRSQEVTRLSLAARANLEREEGGAYLSRDGSVDGGDAPAGDVALADADAELNFADASAGEGEESGGARPDSAGPSARPLSGGGNDGDGDAPVARMTRGGAVGGDEIVADPGAAAAAAAAAAERDAAEREEAASRSRTPPRTPPRTPETGRGARDAALASTPPASGGRVSAVTSAVTSAALEAADAAAAALMNHPTDSQVKPIVLNRRIEVVPEPHFDASALPFEPLTIADMLAAPQAELEAFLTRVYRSVAHSSPINEKVNTLAYFETLCCDTAAANVLINSSLMTLFVRMLRASKAPALRIRLTSAMGLLLRHATYITEELAASGVVTVLTECLRDKNERVRRRAMATLGELLFYIATQQHEAAEAARRNPSKRGGGTDAAAAAAAAAWQIPASTVGTVTRMLRAGEDEIAQHYAVKTIENIVSHGGEWAAKFASPETTASLVTIMTGAKDEQLRGTAASTLARAARCEPAVLQTVLDKYGVKLLVGGLRDPSPKVQQASLNLLNRGLGDLGARARAALASDDKSSLLPTLVLLLERGSAVLRGKALLSFALLFRLHHRWLLAACGTKLLPLLDRLQKDKDQYLRGCLDALVDVIVASVPEMNAAVLAEVERLSRAAANGGSAKALKPDAAALSLFPALIHLLGSAAVRPRVCDATFLADVARYLAAAEGAPHPGSEEFRGGTLALLETLSQCAPALLATPDAVVEHLLPALARMLGQADGSADGRFLALKLTCDTLLPPLLDPTRDGAGSGEGGDEAAAATATRARLVALLRERLLPLCPPLLADEDPIPLYALKLLGGALEADRDMCAEVVNLGLAPKFFEFLSLEHTNNNVHNVRLCLVLASSRAVPMSALCEYGAGRKVAAVLEYAHENAVEPFLEPALGISRAVLARAAEARGRDAGRGGDALAVALDAVVPLAALAPVLIECAAAGEAEVTGCAAPQLAAESLRLTTELLPEEAAAATFDFPRSPLRAAVEAMGTVAAVARNERGFADLGVVPRVGGPGGTPLSLGGSGLDGSSGATSPRRGFASAQRTALEALAAAARTPRLTLSREAAEEAAEVEAALRRLARGEPNPSIAAAAQEAAEGVRFLLATNRR